MTERPRLARTRHPLDGVRLALYVAATGLVVVLAVFAEGSFAGLAADLYDLGRRIPVGVIDTLDLASSLVAWALPVVLAGLLVWRGRFRTTVELLVAGVVAASTSGALSAWLLEYAPLQFRSAFTPLAGEPMSLPVPALPALIIAVVTVTTRIGLRRTTQLAWFAVAGTFAAGLLLGEASVAGTLVALGLGRIVGLTTRLVSGQPITATGRREVAEALTAAGYRAVRVSAVPGEGHHRFRADTDAGTLTVLVLDRSSEGAGLLVRLADRLRTREEILPRRATTLRAITDQMTLLSLALHTAGARTPRLRQVIRLGPDVILLVHDQVGGRPLQELSGDELSDELLADLWDQLERMRTHQLAHRRIAPHTIVVDTDGHIWLLNPSGGEVAAPDLALRADLAQALVTAALAAGPSRAVTSAVQRLGAETVASAMPLLQTVVLARSTRRALRTQPDLLARLRDQIAVTAGGRATPPVQLRRFRPLSLVTGVAAVVALYLLSTQLSEVPVVEVVSQADWRWLVVAVVAMGINYVGAALSVLGFVPEPVPFGRTLAAQVTLGFVRLAGPAAVGAAAINLRLLTKAGVSGPLATASVAAYQLGTVALTVPLIAVLGVVSGFGVSGLRPSVTAVAVAVSVVVVVGLLAALPPIRRRVRGFWEEFVQRGLPRLLEVLSRPRKLCEAIGGSLLQTVALIGCLYACVRATGAVPDPAALAVVQMVGNTVGTAAPTPGGLGAVEAALTAGITAIGTPAAVAVSAVLLFRIVSFWLPILPAWLLWTQLQRRNLL